MARPGPLALALLGAMLLSSAGSLDLPVTLESSTADQKSCSLTGTWENDLRSRMMIGPVDAEGQFRGWYWTAVTSSSQRTYNSTLLGVTNRQPQATFGFVIKWAVAESVSVFAGQCFVDGGGRETLETTWLLREEAAKRAQDWKATRVGRNVFVRHK